jgi:ketosteroid isomerase-like protein
VLLLSATVRGILQNAIGATPRDRLNPPYLSLLIDFLLGSCMARASSLRRLLSFSFLSLLTLAGITACAVRVEPDRSPAAGWAADEAAIRAATTASADAWNRGDLKGHVAIYVDSVTFMTRNGPRPGVVAVEQSFAATYFRDGQPKQQLRFEQVTIRRLDANSALETGRFILSGGGQPDQSGWFTLVWVRTPAGWKAVHDHTS